MTLGQKILNWKQYLRFPSLPCVSHEAVDLMQQLLCEPEYRLGSQASSSVVRPNSMIVQARRSAFTTPLGASRGGDGVKMIKVGRVGGLSWFLILLTQFFRHILSSAELIGRTLIVIPRRSVQNFTIHSIIVQPLAPANGAPLGATRDPLLRDKAHEQ